MKLISLVLLGIITSLAFATDNNGCNQAGSMQIPKEGTDAVSLTVVNSFNPGQQVLGMDIFVGSGNYILGVCKDNSYVQAYDLSGSPIGTLSLNASNQNCFGFVWNNDPNNEAYYANDWAASDLFYTDDFGSSWTTVSNPSGSSGRGMDFDGTDYWQTNSSSALYRFQPGVGQESITPPGIPGQMSGLTTFPYGSNLGVAIAVYQTHNLYFFEWDGSSLTSLGTAACPGSDINVSIGLAYNPTTGNMHWAYSNTSSEYNVVEFSFTIETALERSTWGSIKSNF